MLPYTIDDPITGSPAAAVEVTIDFGGGRKRWCLFVTLEQLASNGDWVDGTKVRVHLCETHMIIVSELNEDIIDRVLRRLYTDDELEARTSPLV
jgi:hypothetical protein